MKFSAYKYCAVICLTINAQFFILTSCNSQRHLTHCEVINSYLKFYNKETKTYEASSIYWPINKIWYSNNFGIEETWGINIRQDTNGTEYRKVELMYYTAIDFRNRIAYSFSSFSDTARILDSYSFKDTTAIRGGWNFREPRSWPRQGAPVFIADTIIDNVVYKRIKMIKETTEWIGYLRCDKEGTVFMYDIDLSKSLGCPIVRVDQVPTDQDEFRAVSSTIEFLADKLTPEEQKVFRVWRKRTRNMANKNEP